MASEKNFVDYVKIFCKSGRGGAGSVHFHRDKFNPKGGPDGGDGGKGGDIILKGNAQLWTLLHLKYRKHVMAEPGQPGSGSLKSGKSGKDVILEVPIGTVIKDAETEQVKGEIIHDKETFCLTAGGKGGKGNFHFKSATNQTPEYAQPGEKHIEEWNILELKILADVGMVGFPNAGKSTLLSVISAAKPEIGDYPFTTLTPNLGMVSYYDNRSFVVADLPGIIEGASEGKGLGIRFLRHIERNSILLFVIPCDTSKSIEEEYTILLQELEKYNPYLLIKDKVLAITKCDLMDQELQEEMQKTLPKIPAFFISSFDKSGITELKKGLWEMLQV